ncbi:hypothetical protein F5Y10DRAFT_284899 [Nemania abortiva]|nr:hypothetical protein F5Y10DRAFT_284899 [Nemania abortiva]
MLSYVVSKISESSELQNINCGDSGNEKTPLHYAARYGKSNVVELLLEMGADVQIKDRMGRTPIDSAGRGDLFIPYGDDETSRILLILEFQKFLQLTPDFEIGVWKNESVQNMKLGALELGSIEDSTQPFTWLHLPEINGIIAFSILKRFGRDAKYPAYATNAFSSSFRRSIRLATNLDLPSRDPSYESNSRMASNYLHDLQVCIVFPCLVLQARRDQKAMRRNAEERRGKITNHYFLRSMLQSERTIDEMYFPSLSAEALNTRNERQVVSREFTLPGEYMIGHESRPILMVTQLWVWRCGRRILTAYPRDMAQYFDAGHIESSIGVDRLKHPGIFTGMIIAHYTEEFSSRATWFQSTLDIFESSIGLVLRAVDEYMDQKLPSRPEIEKEQDFMFRITDIREELAMVQQVLEQQLEILNALINDMEQNNPENHIFIGRQFNPRKADPETLKVWED